jgi:hypothetical protein
VDRNHYPRHATDGPKIKSIFLTSVMWTESIIHAMQPTVQKSNLFRSYAHWACSIASELGQSRCDENQITELKLEFSPTVPPTLVMDYSDEGVPTP